jgi:uncharacterized protein (TIGR02145 family)
VVRSAPGEESFMNRAFAALLPAVVLALPSSPSVARDLSCGDRLVDTRDGRDYPTVAIGEQCWMGRNLDFGRQVPDAQPGDDATVEKTCYGNEAEACGVYGGLYTWNEAMGDACPAGWHLPSLAEWEALSESLGPATAGEQLKAREDHDPPYDGTDAVGFTALPAGSAFRGSFGRQGHWALFWTSTEVNAERAASAQLDRFWRPEPPKYRKIVFDDFYLKENAFSVRCVQNQTPRARVDPGPGRVPRNAGSPPPTRGGTGRGVNE